jgi:hypothetical protein
MRVFCCSQTRFPAGIFLICNKTASRGFIRSPALCGLFYACPPQAGFLTVT